MSLSHRPPVVKLDLIGSGSQHEMGREVRRGSEYREAEEVEREERVAGGGGMLAFVDVFPSDLFEL